MRPPDYVIGIDFDNTIISYDGVMHETARARGLITPEIKGKKAIRDHIRSHPGGEIEWQKLQAEIYGPAINRAAPMEGFSDFLTSCAQQAVPLFVISHKTEFAAQDTTDTNLRVCALDWLRQQGYTGRIPEANIYFESTRSDKINRIRALGCSHFIDDLEETFLEESFPRGVTRILIAPAGNSAGHQSIVTLASWAEIKKFIFNEEPDIT